MGLLDGSDRTRGRESPVGVRSGPPDPDQPAGGGARVSGRDSGRRIPPAPKCPYMRCTHHLTLCVCKSFGEPRGKARGQHAGVTGRGYKKLPPGNRSAQVLCSGTHTDSALEARPALSCRAGLCASVVGEMRSSGRGMASRAAVAALLCASWALAAAAQKYNAIFNFGDSITDTGNLCTNGRPSQITFTQPPYGETYFGTPTCRCCDGRVIPDFLSAKFGLPFLPPSKSTSADFKKGANMAITGATAMDAPFFRSLGLSDKIWNNGPISFQLQWFQQVASSVCGSDCKSYLANSLFVFGEFGGNDYNAMLFGNYNTDQASTYTPQIVSTIANGVEKLIAMGATDIVVPGVLPIGCFPIYCTIYGTSNSADYDSLGCLRKFNDLSTNHNNQLQSQISSLQAKYPSARIMYADFYSAVYDMVKNPGSYGFSKAFEACCGSGGGKYNYQNSARCGMSGASACSNPAAHLSWDGIHLTEAAYKQVTDGWLNGPYCRPAILHG